MLRRPPSSTLTDTLFPYTSLFLSHADGTRNVVCDGVGDRFAVVECPQHRIIEKAFPDALCDGTQHHLALHRRRASPNREGRSEEHTSELQSLMRSSYAVFCLKKKKV